MKGKLILENGMCFDGKIFGELKDCVGEIVFNTGMTGYQEILTDPSYYGQIVVMTYPLIGNYGINLDDMESNKIQVSGFIIHEEAKLPNNFRCEITLDGFLKQNGVVAFRGVDTRYLTKIIREQGAMKAIISKKELTKKELDKIFNNFKNTDAVQKVSTKEKYIIPGSGMKIAVFDFGIKRNILRSLEKRNFHQIVVPWNTTAKEILDLDVDGIFLSNGPGDPAIMSSVIEEIKKLIGIKPIVGICLGHQLLAWAMGGTTTKLKYGHRGCNHPVKDLEKNKIFITSQNHGYVVDKIPENMKVTHINLNDNSIEGMRSEKYNILCVQYHPEAYPGPSDSDYLFDEFLKVIEGGKNVK